MSTRLARVALAASLAVFVSACGQQENAAPNVAATASSPDAAIRKSADLIKQGDIAGLMQNALPPAEFAKVKADWGKDTNEKPITDEDRAKFAMTMEKLTAPNAEQTIYAEIEPQLQQFDAQYQQQLPMYVAMGSGWLQGMVQQNKDLSETDKQQAVAAINALAAWVQKTRFTEPESVKKVLAVATKAARDINLKTLGVYGFPVDQTLDSIKPEVLSNDGKTAKVKVGYTLLGTPLAAETEMVNIDGRWYGKQTIEKLHEQQDAPDKTAPAPAATTGGEAPAKG